MNFAMRATILTVCFFPYLYFGILDVFHHKEHRPLPFAERILHLTLTLTLMIVLPHAYLGHFDVVIPGVVLFVLARSLDEFIYHRKLNNAEIDLHAKTHFGFLVFVIGLMATNWLQTKSLTP
jgi:hypothetical protein